MLFPPLALQYLVVVVVVFPQYLLNFSSESWNSTCFFQGPGIQIVVHNLVSPLGIRLRFQRCAFPSEGFEEGWQPKQMGITEVRKWGLNGLA